MKERSLTPYLFLAPFMLAFLLFFVTPVLYSIYLSFFIKQRSGAFGIATEVFGGFTNYFRAFRDADFLSSFANIVGFGIIQIPIMLALATIIALILDEVTGPLGRFFRSAIYIPYTIPSVIAGLLWGFLYSRNLSPLNYALQNSGQEPFNFLSPLPILLFSIGNIVTWTWTGYNAITLYANLQTVSRELYEAAKVDGATGWNVIRYIKLPLMRPALLLTFVFSIIGTMQIFAEPFVLQGIGFVPVNVTPNTFIYDIASRSANYNYTAALAVIVAGITFIFSIFLLRMVNRSNS
jgi:multiple sugar transport system permease protein